ncbi:MAG: SHOCT domain-containing protein [Verrucomicrobiota bacterium]
MAIFGSWGLVNAADEEHWGSAALTITCIFSAAVVFFVRFRKSHFDVIIYFYRNGAFAFNIWRSIPNEAAVADFTSKLDESIKASHQATTHPDSVAGISSEIDRLGALRKGLLTEEEFSRAKATLLEGLERGSRVVGFHS